MMKDTTSIFTFLLMLSLQFSFTQVLGEEPEYNPISPPNTFQSESNPYYWKNKMPYPGYWQQDIYYQMDVNIDEETNILSGKQTLTYWNNSPDTLKELFYHLYQNAFQPGSYYANLHAHNGIEPSYGEYEAQGLGNEIDTIAIDGKAVEVEYDNTIMRVELPEPLAPGNSVQVYLEFKSYYDQGSMRRRMKYYKSGKFKHFNGAHWYPRVAVYDRKFGWTTDQHLGREFYGDFGTYDVKLTFANNFIVEATGFLQNREEVLPDSLREALDIKHFKDLPWDTIPSIVVPFDSTYRKTWHFYAENIHDFAFTADPFYRLDTTTWNGMTAVAIFQEQHASGWKNAADYTAKVLEVFSRDFGLYGYHKMIVSDAKDGMEYPMLTMDGGKDPGYRGLLVHEIGHNWFYAMVNNNESYRAFMDEGFTQFLTAWGLEAIDGPYMVTDTPKQKWVRRFKEPRLARDSRVYAGYLYDAMRHRDAPLNTHSDGFNGAIRHGGGYRHVYYKAAAMLYNMQYVLGDELFLKSMQHYFNTWKFAHPYPEDFRNAIINYSGVDLNWFFDQWIETTKNVDYKIQSIKRAGKDSVDITFKRLGSMQMPIDFLVIGKDDDSSHFHIPNQWFVKETDAIVLDRWIGWDKLKPTYTARVAASKGVRDVVIDPTNRLADINMLNNRKKEKVDLKFDSRVRNRADWKTYEVKLGPDLWYNSYDGFKPGFKWRSDYMNYKHKIDFTLWFNTRLARGAYSEVPEAIKKKNDPLGFEFQYSTGLDKRIKDSRLAISWFQNDGLEMGSLSLTKSVNPKLALKFGLKSLFRPKAEDLYYLLYPLEWDHDRYNNSMNVEVKWSYKKGKRTTGHVNTYLRSSALLSDYDYHYLRTTWKNQTSFWKFDLQTRVFSQIGSGKDKAPESSLFAAGANPEEMMSNRVVRSRGIVPDEWVGNYGNTTNHFHHGGGLNLRGYAGYFIAETDQHNSVRTAYKGISGASVNAELGFNRIIRVKNSWLRKRFDLNTYLFADAGTIAFENSRENQELSAVRLDAGAGMTFTIKQIFNLKGMKPLVFRFDVPFYLSHAPAADAENMKFRWVAGIGRAF